MKFSPPILHNITQNNKNKVICFHFLEKNKEKRFILI